MYEVINSFRGEHAFLSNYDTARFFWRGIAFGSGEQAFAFAKHWHIVDGVSNDERNVITRNILEAQTPNKAKYWGRRVPLDVVEWDKRKVGYMREIVHAKFGFVKDYAGKLINTGARPLIEGNNWGDKFWGKCMDDDGIVRGLNMLGTILMEERGYWLWYGQAQSDVLDSRLSDNFVERTADYG